ncbi:MAG TPA: helix-turn-helix transcriptional regulator [Ktedonobacteraceae bacterium]|jgi:DNA-binding XRE family transcriptional regulator
MANARRPQWKLRQARIECGLTQSELAEHLGVATKTVQRWEQEMHMPRPYAQRRLCAVLQRTPQELGFVDMPDHEQRASGICSPWTKQRLLAYALLLLLSSLLLALLLLLLILTHTH